jgi:hypothetical protein
MFHRLERTGHECRGRGAELSERGNAPERRAGARTREGEAAEEMVQVSCPGARDGTVTAMEGAATTMARALVAGERQRRGANGRAIGSEAGVNGNGDGDGDWEESARGRRWREGQGGCGCGTLVDRIEGHWRFPFGSATVDAPRSRQPCTALSDSSQYEAHYSEKL